MQLIDRVVFGALTAKLLGTYEKELQDAIRALEKKRFGRIINVGAAEGYYAVGLARNFPNVPVVAESTLPFGAPASRAAPCLPVRLRDILGFK